MAQYQPTYGRSFPAPTKNTRDEAEQNHQKLLTDTAKNFRIGWVCCGDHRHDPNHQHCMPGRALRSGGDPCQPLNVPPSKECTHASCVSCMKVRIMAWDEYGAIQQIPHHAQNVTDGWLCVWCRRWYSGGPTSMYVCGNCGPVTRVQYTRAITEWPQ
jgi:hypothetical protein